MSRLDLTKSEAEESIQRWLDALHAADLNPSAPKMRVLPDLTDEREWGWIVYSQSAEYLEAGKTTEMLAGNAPYFVNRESGKMIATGTALPIEDYVREYEELLRHKKI